MNRLLQPFRSVSQIGNHSSLPNQAITEEAPLQKELPSLPHIINELGFGRAQMQIICTGGAIYFADAAELMMIAAASESVETDFSLSPLQRSSFLTVVFCGVLFGSFCGGSVGDAYGRRLPILLSFAGTFLFSILSAFSWSYISLASFRFSVGVSIGLGQPPQAALINEVSPARFRPFAFALTYILFAAGEMAAATMIWCDNPSMYHLHWRELVAASAVPALMFGLASYFLTLESPGFLASTGQYEEAMQVLQNIRSVNGVDATLSTRFAMPKEVEPSVKHQLGVVLGWQQLPITMIMAMSLFLFNFAFYGALYGFATILPQEAQAVEAHSPAAQQIMGACWELLGYVIGAVVGSFMNRRLTVQVCLWFTLSSLVTVGLAPQGSGIFYAGYYIMKVSFGMGYTVLLLYVTEVFPTDCRATGTAVCYVVARMGALSGAPAFEMIEELSGDDHFFMWMLAGLYVVNSILHWLMPEPHLGDLDAKDSKSIGRYGAVS